MGINLSKNQLVFIYCTIVLILSVFSFCAILFYPQENKRNNAKVSIKSGFTLGQISNLLYCSFQEPIFQLSQLEIGMDELFFLYDYLLH